MKKIVLGLLGLLLLGGAVFLVPTIWLRPWSIDHFYARVFIQFAMRHPMLLTALGMLDGTPLDTYSDDLDDLSVAFQRKEAGFVDRQLRILRSYDRRSMSESRRLSTDVLEWFMADQQSGTRFMFHDYPVNQLSGMQSALPDFLINVHPMKRPKDADNYLARVSKLGIALDQVMEGLKLREQRGIVPPRFVLDKVLAEVQDFAGRPPRENPLYVSFATRSEKIAGLDSTRRGKLLHGLEGEIRETVYPAYRKLAAYCKHLETLATHDDGVWKLPDGDAYYDWCLRHHTTTDLSADSIHALGLREVRRVQDEIRAILRSKGYPIRDPAGTLAKIAEDPQLNFPPGDSGRAMILAGYQEILDDANRRVAPLFGLRPTATVKVERVPPFREATAPGGYYQPGSIDGKRPGIFYANLRDPKETPRLTMRTLVYHEAVPGHHFQISIAQEMRGVPFFRRIIPFTAYSEGWGLYSERLALERGFHRDAYDSLGALQLELRRAVRLVVDTGIHRKHWTREQAIDYMVGNGGEPRSAVVTEIERYIVSPGQACAYMVGELKLLELRKRAMDRLGPRFDVREFHDVVLANGALPLNLLERQVDDWLARKTGEERARRHG